MLRVAMFPSDDAACGFYRITEPARVAAASGGVEVEILHTMPLWRDRSWAIKGVRASFQADVAVLQRPLHHEAVATIPHLQRRGIAVVVELDDDFATLHADHLAFEGVHPNFNAQINWHHLKRACQLADLVTVTTPALARRYGGEKARVLPNCVPESLLHVTAERDGRTVGWGGSTSTHPGDLSVTRGGVNQALADTSARFLTVGPPDDVRKGLRLDAEPDTTDGLPFGEYHQALAQLDVGIAPLLDSAFNRAKSGLKGLEYAALKIPFVASPLPEYARLAAEGIGTLAGDRFRDWRRAIGRLLTDPSLREETAQRAWELVAEHHTYERNGWEWVECWQEAIEARRSKRVAVSA